MAELVPHDATEDDFGNLLKPTLESDIGPMTYPISSNVLMLLAKSVLAACSRR